MHPIIKTMFRIKLVFFPILCDEKAGLVLLRLVTSQERGRAGKTGYLMEDNMDTWVKQEKEKEREIQIIERELRRARDI